MKDTISKWNNRAHTNTMATNNTNPLGVNYSSDSDSDDEPVQPGRRLADLQKQVDDLTRKLEEMQKLITSDALRILALERAQGTLDDETDGKPTTRGTKRPASPPMFAESAGGGGSAYPCPGFGNLLGVCTGSTQNKKTGVIYKFCFSCETTRKNTVLRPCERCNGEQYYDPAKFKCCWHCGGGKKRRR